MIVYLYAECPQIPAVNTHREVINLQRHVGVKPGVDINKDIHHYHHNTHRPVPNMLSDLQVYRHEADSGRNKLKIMVYNPGHVLGFQDGISCRSALTTFSIKTECGSSNDFFILLDVFMLTSRYNRLIQN